MSDEDEHIRWMREAMIMVRTDNQDENRVS